MKHTLLLILMALAASPAPAGGYDCNLYDSKYRYRGNINCQSDVGCTYTPRRGPAVVITRHMADLMCS